MTRFLIVAGEASGDTHAADLVAKTQRLSPGVQFTGLGGPKMAEAGVNILFDPTAHSSTGITEAFGAVPRLFPYLSKLETLARTERPDAAILVDMPEFNLRLAKRLKRAGTRVIYYISPQLWGWREWRVRDVRRYVDEMIVLFHFEVDFYRKHGITARFVGHPIVDQLAGLRSDPQFRRSLGVPEGHRLIGLLPGSRRREVMNMYETLVRTAEILHREDPQTFFAVGKSPNVPQELIDRVTTDIPLTVLDGQSHQLMVNADLLLSTSGTATLEAAVLGAPMVVAYKASWLTYLICNGLRVSKYFTMINILAGREIVPEFLQNAASPKRLAQAAQGLMKNRRLEAVSAELLEVCKLLGEPGATHRAAEEVLKIARAESDND